MEAAAAHKNAEYERIIDGKEHARREREEEFEQTHQLESAEHEKDLAILTTSRKVTVVAAKVKAINQTIEGDEIREKCEISKIPRSE